jgi:DNA-binding transcriptional LysR family regulator
MDTQQLTTLQKIAKEKSFNRTSKELGISQPTVTMRIKALENELGETLVLRTGQKAILTSAGETFLSYVDRALIVLQLGIDHITSGEELHTLTIAGTPTINTYVLPQTLKKFRSFFPDIQLKIYTGLSENVEQMILDGVADIGLTRSFVESKGIRTYKLYPEELRLIVHYTNPLVKLRSISVRDLSQEKILLYRRYTETWSIINDRFLRVGIKPRVTMELEHIVTVISMLLTGAGIAFLPMITVKKELDEGVLKVIEIEDMEPILRNTYIITPKQNRSDAAVSFFRFLHEEFNISR